MGYSGGPAQAVSPIGPVRNVIDYALTEMPSSKIVMGQNMYGYDWTLPLNRERQPKPSVLSRQSLWQHAIKSTFNMTKPPVLHSFVTRMKIRDVMKYGLKTHDPFKRNSI